MIQARKSRTLPVDDLPWPDCFYASEDPDLRSQLLTEHLELEECPGANAFRRKLLERRYIQKKHLFRTETIDAFMHTWMMMKVSAAQSESAFREEQLLREWMNYAKALCITDFDCRTEQETTLLHREWRAFFDQYLAVCLTDRTFGTGLSGTIRLDHDSVSEKLAKELQMLTHDFPSQLHMEEAFAGFHAIAAEAYDQCRML